jgi:DNA-directed RNA polymerase specialized sigma24 family protein
VEEFELIQKVRAGDIESFEKWMDSYSGDIERFAVQYGCSLKQAGEVAEETFRTLHNQLDSIGNEESIVYALYKNTLKSHGSTKQADSTNKTIFPFEEDQELHDQIVQLKTGNKVPFILSKFHKLDDLEIATIIGTSPETVKQAIMEASRDLGVALLEKRLEFLNKSYGRMKSSFRKERVFAKPQKEIQAAEKLKQSISKKAMISWIAGILVLLLLLVVPAVTGEEYKKASAEKYIEQLKVSFEEEVENRYTELGLTEKTKKDKQEFYEIEYGKQARENFEMMIQKEERVIAETGKIDKKNIGKQYDEIIQTLELPSELAEQLVKNPLTSDKEKSEEFIIEYVKRINEIQQAYSSILYRYPQLIEDADVDGVMDIEKFLEKKESYPAELQNALNSMEKQNLDLIPFYPSYAKTELSAQIKASIHKDFRGYIAFLESLSINYDPKPASFYAETIDTLIEIENTLLANVQIEIPYISLGDYYSHLFYRMVVDSETDRIVGSDGKVKGEIKSTWKKIASNGEGSPSAFIMKKIIGEMEASGWTESETQSRLNLYHLDYAMGLAKEGRLHTFEMSGILQSDRGLSSVTFPDSSFEELVEKTYALYSISHDRAVLKDVHPLVVFAVYCLANDREDPETMWHLYNPEDDLQSLGVYISKWRKVDVKLYEMKSLLFDGRESTVGSIGIERGSMTYFDAEMILDAATGWKIKRIDLNSMAFE